MSSINSLSIDIETFSDKDLSKCGVYAYAESEGSDLLLFGYSINGGPVEVIDIAMGDTIPAEILEALLSDDVIKWAYNANFERVFLSVWLRRNYPERFTGYKTCDGSSHSYLNPISWRCTLVWAATMGLPLSLEKAGAVLGLEEQKMKEGKSLIRYFCVPCTPTMINGGRTRNLPIDAPAKWMLFKEYNKRDVEVELQIKRKLSSFPVPDFLWREYHEDQQINDRGIGLDLDVVNNAITFDRRSKEAIAREIMNITGIENPASVQQLKTWLLNNGVTVGSLDKKASKALLKVVSKPIKHVLELRLRLAKSSIKKYQAMQNAACYDKRARGMFMFYGANRSGRFAGRIIQLQNLPQNHMPDLAEARSLVSAGEYEMMDMLYDNIPDTLSQLIRTAFVPKMGQKFIVCDYSAIEARVLSHLAGELWRSEVFKNGGDIYCASASQMFHVKVEKHGVNGHLRQKGKIAELALGYGGSVGALKAMGALEMGLTESELSPLVDAWRSSNPNIVSYWWQVDKAVKHAVKYKTECPVDNLFIHYKKGMLLIELPSGRHLSYVKPKIGTNQFGSESVTYMGVGTNKKWERIESYGPKFVENIVQAISRDILCNAIHNLRNYSICGHVHDEVIIECPKNVTIDEIADIMARPPAWMPDILLRADGYETPFYKKD